MPWRTVLDDGADEVYRLIEAVVPMLEDGRMAIFDDVATCFSELAPGTEEDSLSLRKLLLCVAAGCALVQAEELERQLRQQDRYEPSTLSWPEFDAHELTILTGWLIKEPLYRTATWLNHGLEEKYVLSCLLPQTSTDAVDAVLYRAREQDRDWEELLAKPTCSAFPVPLYRAVSGLTCGLHRTFEPTDVMLSLRWLRENL